MIWLTAAVIALWAARMMVEAAQCAKCGGDE